MKKGLIALAAGTFALGFAEFVLMGIITNVAAGVGVTVPEAGGFISAYAIGVCFGTLILVFGHSIAPKRLLMAFMLLCFAGNAMAALAPSAGMLTVARFISGMPHGAFFGTATIAARAMADKGQEGRAVAVMVLGQTLANTIGVPFGTLLAGMVSWRAAFVFVAIWALCSLLLIWRLVPQIEAVADAGLAGQFRFLGKPGPWIVLGAVFLGNTGIFCWWSYVSPWLETVGGWSATMLPALLVLAGLGMIVGSQLGGRAGDRLTPGWASAIGQGIACVAMLLIYAFSGSLASSAALMVLCCCGLFFPSSPQQLAMVEVGQGGGEMIGSACVQVAFNGGNAVGAQIGQAVLNSGAAYNVPALAGAPITAGAVALLALYALRFESRYHKKAVTPHA
ncbi:MFS transporter [Paratractidigestivibacter faecalis]|uniref:MFS transporter n=1 Tax=Paratractidigestivibacter faecalis TaxID=2292441 RepID=UPI000E3B656A|nr:MFS transporter [Paratractidigestivibacter faecalis]